MKTKFSVEVLLVWILVPPVMLSIFQRGVLDQLFVGIVPGVIVVTAILLAKYKRMLVATLVLLMLCSIWQVWRNFPGNERVFFQTPQPDVRYSDQLQVIDEIYSRAGANAFEIQAYPIPHFW